MLHLSFIVPDLPFLHCFCSTRSKEFETNYWRKKINHSPLSPVEIAPHKRVIFFFFFSEKILHV